jgi:enoyl-CoA hydratase/carnithine racemase
VSDQLLINSLKTRNNFKIGSLVLNSPESLNSLTQEMIDEMTHQLIEWQEDDSIVAVIIEGAGEKALCAGGDIRALYESMVQFPNGPNPIAEKFFESEYRLDYLLHSFSKPIICWVDGIAMGGGAGLMLGSTFKIGTERTRFAMPEIGVGLFPDVGFTSFINKLPEGVGMYLMLTATQLNAADTQSIGLTDFYISSSYKEHIADLLTKLDWKNNSDNNNSMIKNFFKEACSKKAARTKYPEPQLILRLEEIKKITKGGSMKEITENILNLQGDEWLVKGAERFKKGCPTSALIIWEQCNNYSDLTLKEVFKFELNLAIQVTRRSDFLEGIRAAIIDKDSSPEWHFKTIDDVPYNWIQDHLKPAWLDNPLDDL